MRIIHSLEGHSWSGGQQQALFLAQEQARLGHTVLLMCQKGSELETRASRLGLSVRPHDYRGELNPVSVCNLMAAWREFRPEIVNVHRAWAHTQWALASLLLRFRGLVVTRRVLFRPDFNPLSLVKYRSSAVRGYIAVSQAVRGRLEEMGIPSRKIRVVFPATDTDRFDPTRREAAVDLPLSSAGRILLSVANFHRNKGQPVLLEAFDHVCRTRSDVNLVLAGLNTDRGECLSLIERHPARDRIVTLGFRPDVPELMVRAEAFLSASFEEGFPGTVREALAMGLPVILSDIPSHRELGAFFPLRFFPAGAALACARQILSLLDRPIAAAERERNRQEAIRHFSVATMVQNTVAAYEEFLG